MHDNNVTSIFYNIKHYGDLLVHDTYIIIISKFCPIFLSNQFKFFSIFGCFDNSNIFSFYAFCFFFSHFDLFLFFYLSSLNSYFFQPSSIFQNYDIDPWSIFVNPLITIWLIFVFVSHLQFDNPVVKAHQTFRLKFYFIQCPCFFFH